MQKLAQIVGVRFSVEYIRIVADTIRDDTTVRDLKDHILVTIVIVIVAVVVIAVIVVVPFPIKRRKNRMVEVTIYVAVTTCIYKIPRGEHNRADLIYCLL